MPTPREERRNALLAARTRAEGQVEGLWRQFLCFDFNGDSLARREFERSDASAPVKAASGLVILLGVPEGAVILGVDGHTAVIAPAPERHFLHAAPCHQEGGGFHRPERIGREASH